MAYDTRSILKVVTALRKELQIQNNNAFSEYGLISHAIHTEDENLKMVIFQLTDYIVYLLDIIETNELFKNEDKVRLLNHSLVLLETMVKNLQNRIEETVITNKNYATTINILSEKNKAMKSAIANALMEWTRSDAAFTDGVASTMAEKLKDGI